MLTPSTSATTLVTEPVPEHRSRRPVIAIAAVVVVIAVVVGIVLATRSDDDDTTASAGSTLVRYDPSSQKVEVLDPSGAVTHTFDGPDDDSANLVTGLSGRLVFDGSDDGKVFVMTLADGKIETIDVPDGMDLQRTLDPTDTQLVFASSAGADVVLADVATGDTTSLRDQLDEPDSDFLPTRPFGGVDVFTDIKSDELTSLLVPRDGGTAWTVSGNVAAVDGERSLAVLTHEGKTTVSVFDRDKEVGTTDIDALTVGGLLTGDTTALLVSDDGDVLTVDVTKDGDDASKKVQSLDATPRYVIALNKDRVFVAGDDDDPSSSYLLGSDGKTVAEFDPEQGGDARQTLGITANGTRPTATCFLTQPGQDIVVKGGNVELHDVADGKTVATFDATAQLLDTPDGCSAISVLGEVQQLVIDRKVQDISDYSTVYAVSPDLKHLVVGVKRDFVLLDVKSGKETDLDRGLFVYVPD